jgi:hypothetical protein
MKNKIKDIINSLSNLKQNLKDKKDWKPLLLLFNIQTVINQNDEYMQKYQNGVFYKFPFYLYTIEKWDIEHIDSEIPNGLTQLSEQKEWLKNIYLWIDTKINNQDRKNSINNEELNEINETIKSFLINNIGNFDLLSQKIQQFYEKQNTKTIANKETLGNFVLLDQNTNRGYQNDRFPTKRRKIVEKDLGKSIDVIIMNDKIIIQTERGNTSFIPPCTRNVFMKYYTPNSTDIMSWTQDDADAYLMQIYKTLEEFGVNNPDNNVNKEGVNK